MTKTIGLIGFVIISTLACSREGSYKFWDISRFKFDSTRLKDNDKIKLLYTSGGPDNNKDLKYYIHIIAVSQKTGDTVNILTTIDNGFTLDDKDKIFNFFDQNNIATKIVQFNPQTALTPEKLKELEQMQFKKIDKVARVPKFDHLTDNNYPTVIGSIGTSSAPD